MRGPRPSSVVRVAVAYFLQFMGTGITLPFLPAYLGSLGLSGTQVGSLLALTPLVSLVAPPFWGRLADRTGRPGRVFSLLCIGAAATFSMLLVAREYVALVPIFVCYALFASSTSTVLDAIALHRAQAENIGWARLRLFGSVGFVLSSSAFGAFIGRMDLRTVIVAFAIMVCGGVWSLLLRDEEGAPPRAGVHRLPRDRDLALVLASASLHWIASAPFHGMFALHVEKLGLGTWVVGASVAIGVVAEVVLMWTYPRIADRIAPRHLLAVAYVAGVVRWSILGVTTSSVVIVASSVLHGLTFGAFFVGAVNAVARRVPNELRASGQAMLVAVVFGVGGLIGYLGAGAAFDALGQRVFFAAALLDLVPLALIARVRPARS